MGKESVDIEALYRRYGPMVLRRCRALLRNEAAARDAMQDTFVRVLRRQGSLEMKAPSSLLYRISTNLCLNRIRDAKRHAEDSSESMLHAIADASHRDEERSLGRRVLARLFEKEESSTAVIAALHYLDGMTLKEVADEVGLSVSGVRKRLAKLKANLRADALEGVAL